MIYFLFFSIRNKWGLGIGDGDWGLGIGPNPQSPIPNPQSPIPNPHYLEKINNFLIIFNITNKKIKAIYLYFNKEIININII